MPENSYGYLQIKVRTAGGAIPVSRAIVTVKDENENLLAVFFTDESGSTPILKVLAPPKENTSAPDSGGVPFFQYNIDTDKAGYRSVRNIGVPVYPGITSIQPVELIPISEGGEGDYNENIEYNENTPPNL